MDSGQKKSASNHENLADAVLASGVNLRDEEEALSGDIGVSISKRQLEQNGFLDQRQLAWFMDKSMQENGIQGVHLDQEVVNLVSAACEEYISQIVTDCVILARHRKASAGKVAKGKSNYSNSKSEVSKALKKIAEKDKEREERRQQRKLQLGVVEEEKRDLEGEDHRQTNVTASLMMGGSKKKKYSWMQSASDTPNAVSSRGDNGIRYREAREEPNVVLRDLLAALETRRVGVKNTILKGYSKLKD